VIPVRMCRSLTFTASHDLSDSPTGGLTQGNSEVLPAQLEPDGATMLVTAVAPSVGDQLD
jgi:hypothetical protein